MKLISMTEFVLETSNRQLDFDSTNLHEFSYDNLHRIYAYANFLNQPLTLGMFVPCDEDGNVLEEPINDPYSQGTAAEYDAYVREAKQYQAAKERVLFEGLDVISKDQNLLIASSGIRFFAETIEDVVWREPTLTKSAIKQLGI